ncbi:MAG: hypothetical protein ACYDBH_13980 [Acidobacteriaceae bacterium]
MHPDISEFSYGYALTEELIHSPGLAIQAAPLFPSLIEEGQPGGGYDVQIPFTGFPLFLQFKLSDCMVRHTAWEAQAGLLTPPFYRMYLRPMRHSQQHQLLLDLETKGELVYYAAPHFHLPAELNDAYLNKQVLNRSVFFKPSQIGALPDDDRHHIAFYAGQPAYFCSEPRMLLKESRSREAFDKDLIEGFSSRRLLDRRSSIRRLASEMLSSVRELTKSEERDESVFNQFASREPRLQIAYLARAYFGCEIIIVRPRNNAQ